MKFLTFFAIILVTLFSNAQVYNQKTWATYYFGAISRANNVAVDNEGNIIVLGSVSKIQPLPYYIGFTTVGAHKPGFDASGTNYDKDCTLSKFSPDGNLIWATQFGGQSDDDPYQLILDSNNNIYFSGNTRSNSGIATVGSFDENPPTSFDSKRFLTKFDTNGVQQWGTYINGFGLSASICIDINNHIYFNGNTSAASGISTTGAYQYDYQNYVIVENPTANVSNGFVLKFDSNGNRLAGTYLGKTNPNISVFEVTTDSNGDVIVVQHTNYYSNNQLATPGCYQNMTCTSALNNVEATITKLNSSLSQIIWSTYYGGINGNTQIFSVACHNNTIFIGGQATQSNNFTTAGCFQANVLNNTPIYGSGFIASFNSDGVRQWATYYPERVDDISVFNNKMYVTGATNSGNNNLATIGSYQNIFNGGTSDGFFSEFNLDGSRNWSSYFGGENFDRIYSIFMKANNLYIVGTTFSSNNISTIGSLQPNLNIGNLGINQSGKGNMFLAKFNKDNLSTNNFSNLQLQMSPNPNNGQFTLTGNINNLQKNMSLLIYDGLGRQITSKEIQVTGNQINHEFNFANQLSQGLYFAKITDGKTVLQTFKVLVK